MDIRVIYGEYIDKPRYIFAWEISNGLEPQKGDYLKAETHSDRNRVAMIKVTHLPETVTQDYIEDLDGTLPLPKIR